MKSKVIQSKHLFITTSPRTPVKMVPEIELLQEHFAGQIWDKKTQVEFMNLLKKDTCFNGSGTNDPAFSARDRINRAPKALGLITLPQISLTPAGQEYITAKRKNEIFLRQLLKFQIPSPFHRPGKCAAHFWIKPYLEIFRLIRHFETLSFDEIMIFALQLTDYHQFNQIVAKIEYFRKKKEKNKGNYKQFIDKYKFQELSQIFKHEIESSNLKTRETNTTGNREAFLRKKSNNLRDYADACFRYLQATGLVRISQLGKSISIIPEKISDVDYFLKNIDRNPCFIDQYQHFIEYAGNAQIPQLLSDNIEVITSQIHENFPQVVLQKNLPLSKLKEILYDEIENKKEDLLNQQIDIIKSRASFDEIDKTFENILHNVYFDTPLMLEWNTWKAMTMLDGGNIKANLLFDDQGNPLCTAPGKMADIVCDYDTFSLAVEVTMQRGLRQYEMEAEPVARHLGFLRRNTGKPVYGLFIAPEINKATIAHFFTLQGTNIEYYGGKSTIIPLSINVFKTMLYSSHNASYIPQPEHIERFCLNSKKIAEKATCETDWFEQIKKAAANWLQ